MTDEEAQQLRRENQYLKGRCAELQGDVVDLSSQLERLRQTLERTTARRSAPTPNPLAGGQ